MSDRSRRRKGAAAVELAFMLVPLSLLTVLAADFGRMVYAATILTNCARNGALFASDSTSAKDSPYANYQQAALASASGLNPALSTSNISSTNGTDAVGSYVTVTVSYDFPVFCAGFYGGSTITLSRAVTMRISPAVPG